MIIKFAYIILAVFTKLNDTFTKKSVDNYIRKPILIEKLESKINGYNSKGIISSESNKLCYYTYCNGEIESFKADNYTKSLIIDPGQKFVFTVIPIESFRSLLFIEKIYLLTCKILINKISKKYINDSYNLVKKNLYKLSKINKSTDKDKILDKQIIGNIIYYRNNSKNKVTFNYKNSIILYRKLNFSSQNSAKSKRIIVFSIDNISKSTVKLISKNKKLFPNLAKLINSEFFVTPKISSTISNWTQPAAVSMLSGELFERHKIFHPSMKPFFFLNSVIYKNNNKTHNKLKYLFSERYRCGSNWRLRTHQGSHAFFNNCFSCLRDGDLYNTLLQTFKSLDLAGEDSSLHWIDIMDTHHPIYNKILPYGSLNYLEKKSFNLGLGYETSPKITKSKKIESSKEVYLSQIVSLDNAVGSILEKSFSNVPQENHLIALISDHGTGFMNQENEFTKTLEKHQSLMGFYSENIDKSKRNQLSKSSFSPSEFLDMIYFFCNQNREDYKLKFKEYNYSQIFYPGKKYEFIYFKSNNIIFKFVSSKVIPNSSFEKIYMNLRKIAREILSSGDWYFLKNDINKPINQKDVPINILDEYYFVVQSWGNKIK
tara:strand:+ start:49141 stop:50940 length:1800 start_codon:yes stop_codon:yes gene_type:complete